MDHFPSKEKVYYNFFSSNSCNFISGSSHTKEDCPKGYVFCKNATESTGFTLFESLITFKEAEIRCKAFNTTMCKELLFLRFLSYCFLVSPIRFEEVSKTFAEKNIKEDHLLIWTDFERINISHFR